MYDCSSEMSRLRKMKSATCSSSRVLRKRAVAPSPPVGSAFKVPPLKRRSAIRSKKKSNGAKRARIQSFDKISDDTILHIMQLLEAPHASIFGKAFPRMRKISAKNRTRLRPTYPPWPLLAELNMFGDYVKGARSLSSVTINFDQQVPRQSIELTTNSYSSMMDEIVFERITEEPEFGLSTEKFVALIQGQTDQDGRVRWVCDLRHGAPLDVVTFLVQQLSTNQKIHCVNIAEAAVQRLLQANSFSKIDLDFAKACTLSSAALLRILGNSPQLKDFCLSCREEFHGLNRKFFKHPRVRKLQHLTLSPQVRATGLDDTNIGHLTKTWLHLEGVNTEITLNGIRDIIEKWKKSATMSSPYWQFNFCLEGKEVTTPKKIWRYLLREESSHRSSLQQVIKRDVEGKFMEKWNKALEVMLVDVGLGKGMQGIMIKPKRRRQLAC